MKKILLAAAIASVLNLSAIDKVQASGIPVVDVASLLQMVMDGAKDAQQFAQQISEARNRLNELKNQGEHYKDMVEGHYNFEDLVNDPNLNQFMNMDDWKDAYNDTSDLASMRDEFGLHSDNAAVQRRYDRKLQNFRAQQKYYDATINRNNQLQKLVEQFNRATTPAAKEDIGNAIAFQQVQVENDQQMMKSLNQLMKEQELLESSAAARAHTQQLLYTGAPKKK
ncbi:hypothetical protein KFE26_21485 [Shewanella sp. M16]|uniref:type IV secretion system protein n=1 Tax=Shewanella sp. M16 TaxID=2830837 RepID=UPI001BAF298D|nr:type IV secretion system protein [Shewanella sp. M16]MBS0044843.1 hypothetical protein [Shewanella sp. M16]